MRRHFYTKEEDMFLKDNVEGITLKELTKIFNKYFNCELSETSIKNRKNKLKIFSGINGGWFKKGNVPFNKGKKWDEFMSKKSQKKSSKTTFKKGNIPVNHHDIGKERLDKNGYIELKIEEPNKWMPKHRYIYEQHYGKVPKDHKVIFCDKNNRNFDIDNLIMVSNSEHIIMNNKKLRYKEKKLTKTGYLIAKIIKKRKEIYEKNINNKRNY